MKRERGFTLIELLIVVAIIGIIAAIAIPNLLNAIDRGKQKRTMMDLRTLGAAVETYSIDHSMYPAAASITALEAVLEPSYIRTIPKADGWAREFIVTSTTTQFTIGSAGKDGGALVMISGGGPQTNGDFDDAIIWANGAFAQWPEGMQTD